MFKLARPCVKGD